MNNPEISRRSFIEKSLTGIASLSAGHLIASCQHEGSSPPSARASLTANVNGITIRRDIGSLAPDDDSLLMLKEAVQVLHRRSSANQLAPDGWYAHAVQHSMFCFTNEFERQVHFTWLFYPWHRAFLYFLEKKLQGAINEPSLALHYWDWTKTPYLPDVYWGEDNPLYDRTRLATREDSIPDDYMNIQSHLRTPTFKAFGGYPKGSPDLPFGEGVVEQSTHNCIHNWIGGNMDNFATAATDPVFSGHHGNVDRLWEAWLAADPAHKNPEDRSFLDYVFNFTDAFGYPTKIKVSETLNTEDLGYRFENLDFTKSYEGANERPHPQGNQHTLVQPVEVEPGQRQAIADAVAGGFQRVILKLDRFKLPYVPICIRVFLNERGKNVNQDTLGTEYVTTVTILPVGKPNTAQLEKEVIMQAEVGSHLAELIASGKPLQATLEPVKVPGREIPDVTTQIEIISIEFDA